MRCVETQGGAVSPVLEGNVVSGSQQHRHFVSSSLIIISHRDRDLTLYLTFQDTSTEPMAANNFLDTAAASVPSNDSLLPPMDDPNHRNLRMAERMLPENPLMMQALTESINRFTELDTRVKFPPGTDLMRE